MCCLFKSNGRPKHPDHGFMRVFGGKKGEVIKGQIIQEILRILKIIFRGI